MVAIGVAVGAFLLLGGAKAVKDILPGDEGPDMTAGELEFRVTKSTAIATVPEVESKTLAAAAKKAAGETTKVLDKFYTEAFLDPANWREGTYDNVWTLFDGAASEAAQRDVEALTLGAAAGDAYEVVEPAKSTLEFKVLLDEKNQPNTVVATVQFQAKAHSSDGTTTIVVSTGEVMLIKTGAGWRIISYDIARNDELKQPEPSPTGSGSPTATASPTEAA